MSGLDHSSSSVGSV